MTLFYDILLLMTVSQFPLISPQKTTTTCLFVTNVRTIFLVQLELKPSIVTRCFSHSVLQLKFYSACNLTKHAPGAYFSISSLCISLTEVKSAI